MNFFLQHEPEEEPPKTATGKFSIPKGRKEMMKGKKESVIYIKTYLSF